MVLSYYRSGTVQSNAKASSDRSSDTNIKIYRIKPSSRGQMVVTRMTRMRSQAVNDLKHMTCEPDLLIAFPGITLHKALLSRN